MNQRGEILRGIENPPKAPSASIGFDKLSAPLSGMPKKETDYTLPKTNTPAPASTVRAVDPYRESVE